MRTYDIYIINSDGQILRTSQNTITLTNLLPEHLEQIQFALRTCQVDPITTPHLEQYIKIAHTQNTFWAFVLLFSFVTLFYFAVLTVTVDLWRADGAIKPFVLCLRPGNTHAFACDLEPRYDHGLLGVTGALVLADWEELKSERRHLNCSARSSRTSWYGNRSASQLASWTCTRFSKQLGPHLGLSPPFPVCPASLRHQPMASSICDVCALSSAPWKRHGQVFSIGDKSTNFCNLHNLYCGSAGGCQPVMLCLKLVMLK